MITFSQPVDATTEAQHQVALPYHQRVKGRLRIVTLGGVEAGILTERGKEIVHGQKLRDSDDNVLEVTAQPEAVSVAVTESALLFARACYHVGNRHAEVQIEKTQLIYLEDHVMDSMLVQLGLTVEQQVLPFSPENGAYAGGHSHSHHRHDDHTHVHSHHEQ